MDDFRKKIIKHKIRSLPNLPTLSASVIMILRYLREEEVNMVKTLSAINRDQVLVAAILRLINSGFYGLVSEVKSVDHAVNLLGITKVKDLLYSLSIMESLQEKGEALWFHSYSSYCLMEDLMKQCPELNVAPNLPLTMLMHDLGQVVLEKLNPAAHSVAVEDSRIHNKPLAVIERQRLGVDHAEAGGWLLELWEMPEDILTPIAWHHTDNDLPEKFIRETVLVRMIDAMDLSARGLPHVFPPIEILNAAGIEEFDRDFWQNRHARVIDSLDATNPAIGQKAKKREQAKEKDVTTDEMLHDNIDKFKDKAYDFDLTQTHKEQ